MISRAAFTPARWPATRGRWRRWAQRPLPSMMTARCWGNCFRSSLSRRSASSRLFAFKRSDAFTRIHSRDARSEKLAQGGGGCKVGGSQKDLTQRTRRNGGGHRETIYRRDAEKGGAILRCAPFAKSLRTSRMTMLVGLGSSWGMDQGADQAGAGGLSDRGVDED